MNTANTSLGKILYGLLFLLALPLLLWYWAIRTEPVVTLPAVELPVLGIAVAVTGGVFMLWGMLTLMVFGKGLPMNAYPPQKLVKEGPYRLFRHPIYVGFGVMLAGVSIWKGSASGLWLVTPVTVMGMIALVLGYEKLYLKARFPGERLTTYLQMAERESAPASTRDRWSAFFWVFSAFLAGNLIIAYLAGSAHPLLEESWRGQSFFENIPVYGLSLLFVFATPFLLALKKQIRSWTLAGLIGMGLLAYLSLLWPGAGAQYFPVDGYTSTSGSIWRTALSCIPLFLILISLDIYIRRYRRFTPVLIVLALFLCAYQLAVSRSSILHAATGLTIYLIASNYFRIWLFLRRLTERIANSWKEWVYGPIRVINHGFYVGFGSFSGILLSGWLAGPDYAWAIMWFVIIVMIFSALWAQLIEGSEKLKRPFGYYGALVGVVFVGPLFWLLGYNIWVIIGVVSVLMTWSQAVGRLRCLINGCCHGSPTNNHYIGIRYFHHRSRVCGISGLRGALLHPTPLYAILWLLFVGFMLLVLWKTQFAYTFIFGMYLILTGMGRFVEEAYRGEVQTPILRGLRLYQWTAIISVAVGIVMTIIPMPLAELQPSVGGETFLAALIGGLFTLFTMGIDFPGSNARFSRLV